jgi:hypothetical protein
MDPTKDTEIDRVRLLAQSLDCMPEEDLCLLANVSPTTAENWRKRGKGPAYVLLGNRFLYPLSAVADFVKHNVRERTAPAGKAVL